MSGAPPPPGLGKHGDRLNPFEPAALLSANSVFSRTCRSQSARLPERRVPAESKLFSEAAGRARPRQIPFRK